MPKYFLLIAGELYYPDTETGDWRGCFETKEEAEEYLKTKCGHYDWHDIVDLREWIGRTDE